MIRTEADLNKFMENRRQLGIKPGLERLDYLLQKVGHPQKSIPTVHIAGTNGKGSTLTYLKEILAESDYRVGTFQSPGLPTIFDHMAINNHSITPQEFLAILNEVLPIIEEMDERVMSPSEYEILMVIALLYFRGNIDIAIVEAAMGGREDVTNRVNPLLTIITTIDFDHMKFLGNTLEQIAYHKAGIIKEKTPVIIGDLDSLAKKVVLYEANNLSAPTYVYNEDFSVTVQASRTFNWSNSFKSYPIKLSMLGDHQIHNASLAIQAIELLKKKGFSISNQTVLKGLLQTKLANRIEVISQQPTIILDGAHNVQSITKLVETLKKEKVEGAIKILFSGFRDKNIRDMLKILSTVTEELTITNFPHERALTSELIEDHYRYDPQSKRALLQLLENSEKNDMIIITGSLYFVEYIKNILST
ncbi:bifunctional folylpolyglutamate synthase/dihydrofolate synthase [Gracilibacillus kekensis]|uniref:tetrahydrofolate synthase n=1 Tax=Gracilibacillus kekensis TaxID=1027249 RepID=A0A1M7NVU7_9BACI|nr:folylpolyglutamate synthase/dihydrofolate synthase family protein [Gracilibacillus kekensis]SHN08319.1 dihydrofolate synthase / folylpolyglutamate synthase [Gracilibacillus kekensis]